MRASADCFRAPLVLRIICFLLVSAERSRTLGCARLLGAWLETSFSTSRLRRLVLHLPRLYPAALWARLDRLSAVAEFSLSPPVLVGAAYAAFLVLGGSGVSRAAFLPVAVFVPAFALGYRVCSAARARRVAFEEHSQRLALSLLLASLAALCLDIYRAGAVPLIEPAARAKLSVALTYASTFLVPAAVLLGAELCERHRRGSISTAEVRMYLLALAAGAVFLITLLGFRTQTAVAVLSFLILMRMYRLIGNAEILAAAVLLVAAVGAIGAHRLASGGGEADIGEVLGGRAKLTVAVYDQLVRQLQEAGALLTGYYHGRLALSTFSSFLGFVPGPGLGARTAVAQEFGVSGISMTSTLLGTVVLDLGLVGVALFGISSGAAIGSARAIAFTRTGAALYSTLLAYILVGIETGLVDFSVLLLFSLPPLLLLCSLWRCSG